jgi:hypothetical protein
MEANPLDVKRRLGSALAMSDSGTWTTHNLLKEEA